MRFWTAFQGPLSQAALVEDGKVVKRIPNKPPQTPAKKVMCVSQFDDKLIIGRRTSIELWSSDGKELLKSFYHKHIFGLHEVQQYEDKLLVASSGIDTVFLLDQNSEQIWSWWAYKDGYSAEPKFLNDEDWQTFQISGDQKSYDNCHLNSARIQNDDIMISLMARNKIIKVPIMGDKSELVKNCGDGAHSPIFIDDKLVYGDDKGFYIGDKFFGGYKWVKRIYEFGDSLLITHERGVDVVDKQGKSQQHWNLPRPFGLALIEE